MIVCDVGVLSYFTFLRGLFFLSIPSFVLNFAFISVPQLLANETQRQRTVTNITFTGEELLTGAVSSIAASTC